MKKTIIITILTTILLLQLAQGQNESEFKGNQLLNVGNSKSDFDYKEKSKENNKHTIAVNPKSVDLQNQPTDSLTYSKHEEIQQVAQPILISNKIISVTNNVPKVYQKVEFQGVDDLELDNDGPAGGIYQKFENKLQDGTIEKSIQVWIRLTPYVKRTEWTNCFFLGQNQEFNDNSYLGDRSLTLYVIDNILHFPTYDLNTKKVNYNQNLNFEQSEEGKWCLIYFGYSDLQQKAFVYSQFQGSQANVLNYNGIRHKSSNIYHLFVGQRPSYKNFPGRIVNLVFCGGSGCYREDGFNQQWDSVPKNKVYQKVEFQGVDDIQLDYNGPAAGIYQKFENKLQSGTIEKSISVWIRLTPSIKRSELANCFLLSQNSQLQDNAVLGDQSLALYVIIMCYNSLLMTQILK
ncbi:induced during granule regeneration 1 precursor, putative, partial [Ichthyophthirius multifiliis]